MTGRSLDDWRDGLAPLPAEGSTMSDAQDAARYRWLRQARKSEHWRATIYGWIHVAQGFSTHGFTLSGDKLDVIVDAAMREDAAKSERAAENNEAPMPATLL